MIWNVITGFLVDICRGYKLFIMGGSTKFSVEFYTLGMDKSWMKESRSSKKYEDGVDLFLKFAIDNGVDPNMISYPCKCVNL